MDHKIVVDSRYNTQGVPCESAKAKHYKVKKFKCCRSRHLIPFTYVCECSKKLCLNLFIRSHTFIHLKLVW